MTYFRTTAASCNCGLTAWAEQNPLLSFCAKVMLQNTECHNCIKLFPITCNAISRHMLTKIRRQDAFDKYQNFPWYDPTNDYYFFPKVYKSYILTLASKSIKGHAKALSLAVAQLSRDLDFDSLIFLGDAKTPWFYQDNDYSPVKSALEFLQDNKVGKRFNGALQVDTAALDVFVKHLFWLTRCNASLPIIHFMDVGQNVVCSLCKYGNVHISTLNKGTDKRFQRSIEQSNFEFLRAARCSEPFSKTSAIKRRQVVV